MANSESIRQLINKHRSTFSDPEKQEFERRGYDVWSFSSDNLLALVLQGNKRATASLYQTGDKVSVVGSYGVITDANGTAQCLVKYTGHEVKPFSEVGLEFAEEEGEGFKTIEQWRDTHRPIFLEDDPTLGNDSLILCEHFELVYPS